MLRGWGFGVLGDGGLVSGGYCGVEDAGECTSKVREAGGLEGSLVEGRQTVAVIQLLDEAGQAL